MKASEIRKLSADEMNAKLLELKDELFKLRFQQAVNSSITRCESVPLKKISLVYLLYREISSFTALRRKEREVNIQWKETSEKLALV